MQVGDWIINDFIGIGYFGYETARILISACVVLYVVWLVWKELKENYIDVLRMSQHISMILWFCNKISIILWLYWYKHTNILSVNIIDEILGAFIFFYYFINLFTWYLLNYHITTLNQLKDGARYQELIMKIKSVESRIIHINKSLFLIKNFI